jgi:hypothetical protein
MISYTRHTSTHVRYRSYTDNSKKDMSNNRQERTDKVDFKVESPEVKTRQTETAKFDQKFALMEAKYEDRVFEVKSKSIVTVTPSEEEPFDGKTVVILGITGHVGKKIALYALEQGFRVIGTSRSERFGGLKESKNLKLVTVRDQTSEKNWEAFAKQHIRSGGTYQIVNVIGGAHPPGGTSLYDLNGRPVLAAFEGIAHGADPQANVSYVQTSSILASLEVKGEYADVKKDVDDKLMKKSLGNLTIVRIGYALDDPEVSDTHVKIDNEHAYAPEQFARWPFQPVIGKNVTLQPVAMSDIVTSIVNASDVSGTHVVDAVGEEVMTQEGLFKFFVDLNNGTFRPVYLGYDVVTPLSVHFSKGHFAPYAIEYCKAAEKGENVTLDHAPFESLAGQKLRKIGDLYQKEVGQTLVLSLPPVSDHAKEIFWKCLTEADARTAFVTSVGALNWKNPKSLLSGKPEKR